MVKTVILIIMAIVSPAWSQVVPFSITLNYSATADQSFKPYFDRAVATWQAILPSYINGRLGGGSLNGLQITATVEAIDGVGNLVGSAGPTAVVTDNAGYVLATAGGMTFDSADAAPLGADFETVVLHEMGHILGIGTLWTYNNLYVSGSGNYTGANALAQFQSEYNQLTATSVPVELGGGVGTANGHWNEVDSGAGLTGLVSSITGEDMAYELMTGWLDVDQPAYISNMTRGSLQDLGYNALFVTVPEPTSFLMMLCGGVLAFQRTRRRS